MDVSSREDSEVTTEIQIAYKQMSNLITKRQLQDVKEAVNGARDADTQIKGYKLGGNAISAIRNVSLNA